MSIYGTPEPEEGSYWTLNSKGQLVLVSDANPYVQDAADVAHQQSWIDRYQEVATQNAIIEQQQREAWSYVPPPPPAPTPEVTYYAPPPPVITNGGGGPLQPTRFTEPMLPTMPPVQEYYAAPPMLPTVQPTYYEPTPLVYPVETPIAFNQEPQPVGIFSSIGKALGIGGQPSLPQFTPPIAPPGRDVNTAVGPSANNGGILNTLGTVWQGVASRIPGQQLGEKMPAGASPGMPSMPVLKGAPPAGPMLTAGMPSPAAIGRAVGWVGTALSLGAAGRSLMNRGGGNLAVQPDTESVRVRRCPPGFALAIDGLCYPRQMLPRALRMHKPEPRPVVSRSDQKAIRKADAARKRLVNLTKQAGAHASLTKPRRLALPPGKKR